MATGSGEESTSAIMDDYETLISTTDVELLKRAWRNEKAAPEILQYESSLVQRIKEQIELAEQNVEMFEADSIDPLTVSLYQMDLDRTQFLLRSYLRVRLQKIEEYLFHILKTDEYLNRLSKQEQMFARRCTDDLGNHLDETVLSKLPDNYQSILKQSITSEEDDMDFLAFDCDKVQEVADLIIFPWSYSSYSYGRHTYKIMIRLNEFIFTRKTHGNYRDGARFTYLCMLQVHKEAFGEGENRFGVSIDPTTLIIVVVINNRK
ncbi:hypothetical protein GH714_007623 [Hevea brasiliensis]|uniref:GINS subunit domain-containing protein n=1 Tax=Hevea brasiliensis TaxID=3981 RepID=A0A6A6MBL9_HEVBR|nr:hypothetical protein GH714_007623 [Hevea brasiliensis]